MKKAVVLVAVLVVAAFGAAVARALQFQGAAKPGVHVVGIDVSGKSRAQIVSALREWTAQRIAIRANGRTYRAPRSWLVSVAADATAERALQAGRWGSLVVSTRVDVAPVVTRSATASSVLTEIEKSNTAPVSAAVRLVGGHAVATASRDGLTLDRRALLRRLANGTTTVVAPVARERPKVTDEAAAAAAKKINRMLAAPVALQYRGARLGAITGPQLARALNVGLVPSFDGERLAKLVRPRLGRWVERARNARFVVEGGRVRVVPSRPGRDVSAAQLARAVLAAAGGDRVARIALGRRQPDLTTAEAKALGIRKKVVSYTTQMGVSSANRIYNIHLMANFIDGTIIKPGEVFSFNGVVGPRTAERGFREGQMIVGSLLLPSIGGGVCQTATTLFNDAFELGLPIVERTNHNLYLAHYPLGRDATVEWGGPDLKFKNDLPTALLIKASYTDETLTFTMYGTPSGRRVEARTGPKTNWTSPSMNYAVDPNAPRGSAKVVKGTGEKGFDIEVTRKVYEKSGKLLLSDVFKSHYIPDSPTTVYGPGRTPPGPYIVLPTSY